MTIVNLPDGLFNHCPLGKGNGTPVPTIATLDDAFAAAALDAETVGPYAIEDPDTDLAQSRHCVWVPPVYLPLVLGAWLTPQRLWNTLRRGYPPERSYRLLRLPPRLDSSRMHHASKR